MWVNRWKDKGKDKDKDRDIQNYWDCDRMEFDGTLNVRITWKNVFIDDNEKVTKSVQDEVCLAPTTNYPDKPTECQYGAAHQWAWNVKQQEAAIILKPILE